MLEAGAVMHAGGASAVMHAGDSGFISGALGIHRQPIPRPGRWDFEHSA